MVLLNILDPLPRFVSSPCLPPSTPLVELMITMTRALSLLFTALAISSPVLGQSLAQKVADLRLAATAVDRVKLLADDEVSN